MGAVIVILFLVGLFVWMIASLNKKAYSDEPMPSQDGGEPSRSSSGKLSPKQLADIAGEKIAKSFSADMFREFFGGVPMAEGWTIDDAFAEWCSLGNLALVIASWSVFSGDKGLNIIDYGRKALVRQWRLSEDVFEKLRAIANETEAAAVKAYGTCKDGAGLSQFFGGYANRIAGSNVPIGMSHFESLLSGYKDLVLNPITISGLARLFTETCVSTKTLLESADVDWAQLAPAKTPVGAGNEGKPVPAMDYRGDYGNLLMPPSASAASILSSMTKDERLNFEEMLKHLQKWVESAAGNSSSFHPEARAAFWGMALAKIADHYYENGNKGRALSFTTSAWNISRYPVFAYNAGTLSLELGDTAAGQTFLESYLAEYRDVLTNNVFGLINPDLKAEELEDMADTAKLRLSGIGTSKTNVQPDSTSQVKLTESQKKVLSTFNQLRNVAEQGHAEAQYELGKMYLMQWIGLNIGNDVNEAIRWFRKAAEQGHIDAQVELGNHYRSPLSTKQDFEQALHWYRKAAEQDNAEAQYHIGRMYESGDGVPKSAVEAASWVGKAAAQEHEPAVKWIMRAAEDGISEAQYNLGLMYYEGEGVYDKDDGEAIRWFRKAAEQGHPDAQYEIGMSYKNGEGVEQNLSLAAYWFEKMVTQDHTVESQWHNSALQHLAALRKAGIQPCAPAELVPGGDKHGN